MAKLCAEDHIALTPYSALAGGRLSKRPGQTSLRLEQDSYAKLKYDATAKQDGLIIGRVAELAEKRGRFHDGNFPGLVAAKGGGAGCGRDKAFAYRGRGPAR